MIVTIKYKPRPFQKVVHSRCESKRWNLNIAHRRFGKTILEINRLIKSAMTCKLEYPHYGFLAPTYAQGKAIAWNYLQKYSEGIPGLKKNEQELRIDYPNKARIRIFGCDNPDGIRGLYFDGVVFDEFGQMSPRIFTEIIRPAVSDRKGWCDFIGTFKGHNHFYDLYQKVKDDPEWNVNIFRASETGVIDAEELAGLRKHMSEDEYNQEYECCPDAAIQGAYYAKELSRANEQGRICNVPLEIAYPVDTYWDLGVGHSTAIWFVQCIGKEIRVIDCYENDGSGLDHYIKVLDEKRTKLKYNYGKHTGPHDLSVKELGTGKTRLETARSLGIEFDIAPKLSVEDGINAVQILLDKCWFDKTKCEAGLNALRNYRRTYNDKKKTYSDEPHDDWSCDYADAFRYFAVSPQIYHDIYSVQQKHKQSELLSEWNPYDDTLT